VHHGKLDLKTIRLVGGESLKLKEMITMNENDSKEFDVERKK
jgi:hypothetical protein